MRAVFLLGRAIFGGFFVYNGINHFLNEQGMRQYAASKGVASRSATGPRCAGRIATARHKRPA